MSTDLIKIRNKVTEKEAMLWQGDRMGAVIIVDWIHSYGTQAKFEAAKPFIQKSKSHPGQAATIAVILIDTLEGVMRARPGDFIIKGLKDEFYPCNHEIFAKSYDIIQ